MHGMPKIWQLAAELNCPEESRAGVCKKLDEEQRETRVAYEVSASRIYMIEEGE